MGMMSQVAQMQDEHQIVLMGRVLDHETITVEWLITGELAGDRPLKVRANPKMHEDRRYVIGLDREGDELVVGDLLLCRQQP